MKTLKAKIQVYFLVSALIPFILFGIGNIMMTSKQIKSDFEDKMKTVSDIKQKILNDHLVTIGKNMEMLGENKAIVKYLNKLSNKAPEGELKETYSPAYNAIHNYQENFWGHLHHIFIVDIKSNINFL